MEQWTEEIPGLVIKPGDKVLIAFKDFIDSEHAQQTRDKLIERFPGVEFTLVAGVSSIAVMHGDQ